MSGVKVRKLKTVIKNDDLTSLFNQMTGTTEPEPDIALEKYKNIHACVDKICTVLSKFTDGPCPTIFSGMVNAISFIEIRKFVIATKNEMDSLRASPPAYEHPGVLKSDANEFDKAAHKLAIFKAGMPTSVIDDPDFMEKYKSLKTANCIQQIILSARNIKQLLEASMANQPMPASVSTTHPKPMVGGASKARAAAAIPAKKHDLEDKTNLSDKFIVDAPGLDIKLFTFSSFNFKIVMINDKLSKEVRDYMLQMLRYFYEQSQTLIKIITSPDMDMDKFANTFIKSIEDLRKYIPRCDRAFNKLRDSIGIMKSNFGNYYKDFVIMQTASPTVILESYIQDVAKSSKMDAVLLRQFRTIVSFCRVNMDKNKHKINHDPRIDNVLNLMYSNLDILGGKSENGTATSSTNEQINEIFEEIQEHDDEFSDDEDLE